MYQMVFCCVLLLFWDTSHLVIEEVVKILENGLGGVLLKHFSSITFFFETDFSESISFLPVDFSLCILGS